MIISVIDIVWSIKLRLLVSHSSSRDIDN